MLTDPVDLARRIRRAAQESSARGHLYITMNVSTAIETARLLEEAAGVDEGDEEASHAH